MLPPLSTILPTRRTRVVLSTCHLNHDPQNNEAANLAALCQRCHLLTDAPEHRPRRAATVRARRALGDLFEGAIWVRQVVGRRGVTLGCHLLWRSMAAKHSLHVALTEPLVRHVRDQVAAGRYTTASEVLREALLLMIERDAKRDRVNLSAHRSFAHHG